MRASDLAILQMINGLIDVDDINQSALRVFHYALHIGEAKNHGIPEHIEVEAQVNKARAILAKHGSKEEKASYRPQYLRRKSDKEFLVQETQRELVRINLYNETRVSSLSV